MIDASPNDVPPPPPRFPFITAGATLGVLFLFLFLTWSAPVWLTYLAPLLAPSQTPSSTPDAGEPKFVPNLAEVKARNEAALKGVGAKMSLEKAHGELVGKLKGPGDRLPFPAPEPPLPPAPPKKDEKKEKP